MKILVTGGAGFIGYHTSEILCQRGDEVVILDNINDYYDVRLKYARLRNLGIEKEQLAYNKEVVSNKYPSLFFIQVNFEDNDAIEAIFKKHQFDKVCHLGAQAGVRYSLTNPRAYLEANLVGFFNIIDNAKLNGVKNFVYASSSSVYGKNTDFPFSTSDKTDTPMSLYAATKKSNELIAHTYSHLHAMPTIGLRFFTVYGPWGRPDMALFIFTKNILEGKSIDVYNFGEMKRDFTYVDDIVKGVVKSIDATLLEQDLYRVYNIGNNQEVLLMDFIKAIEKKLNKKANINLMPIQPGDVERTFADVSELVRELDYKPSTTIEQGIEQFIDWYLEFYPQGK